jgi:hypothetical protein
MLSHLPGRQAATIAPSDMKARALDVSPGQFGERRSAAFPDVDTGMTQMVG